MLLGSVDGAHVRLGVDGYQFSDAVVGDSGTDWDANWLLVSGCVRDAGGESWTFCDPGLTTWEVAEVADWLERAARGEVQPVRGGRDPDDEPDDELDDELEDDERPSWWDLLQERGWLVFIEPCLSLGVAAGPRPGAGGPSDAAVRLLVGLGAEWAPPPVPGAAHRWVCVELVVSSGQLVRAAADLRATLTAFPPR